MANPWEDGGFINTNEPQQLTASVSIGTDDKNKAIAAVSVSQVTKLTRPNEGMIVHNQKIYHVNLVALIHEIIDMNPQKVHVLVDDYTSGGPLEVTHIIGDTGTPDDDQNLSMFRENIPDADRNGNTRSLSSLKVGDYIRCIGVVKFSQDKANLVAYSMRYLDDVNEITVHMLEVIRDSLYYQKLQSSGGGLPLTEDRSKNQYQATTNDDFGSKLSTREKHLLRFLKEKSGADGILVDTIAENFKAFSKSEILETLETLSQEGLCWQGEREDLWCVH